MGSRYVDRLIKDEKATDFADAFSNLSLTQSSGADFTGMDANFKFQNAIEDLTLYEYGGIIYIELHRSNDFVQDSICFYKQELSPIIKIVQISRSLEDYSEEIPESEVPH